MISARRLIKCSLLALFFQSLLFCNLLATYDVNTVGQMTHVVGGSHAYALKGIDSLWTIAGCCRGKTDASRRLTVVAQIDSLDIDGLAA